MRLFEDEDWLPPGCTLDVNNHDRWALTIKGDAITTPHDELPRVTSITIRDDDTIESYSWYGMATKASAIALAQQVCG